MPWKLLSMRGKVVWFIYQPEYCKCLTFNEFHNYIYEHGQDNPLENDEQGDTVTIISRQKPPDEKKIEQYHRIIIKNHLFWQQMSH